MSGFYNFGGTLDPLDTGDGTTTGTFSASVPTASGLRGSGVAAGSSGTSRGTFKVVVPAVIPKASDRRYTVKVVPPTAATLPRTSSSSTRTLPTVTPAVIPRTSSATTAPKVSLKYQPSLPKLLAPPTGTPSVPALPRAGQYRPTLPRGTGSGSGGTGSDSTTPPAWMSAPYIDTILNMKGWTGPSNYYPGVVYTVVTGMVDGYEAPLISVMRNGSLFEQVTPNKPGWINTASLVIAAKSAADTGISPPPPSGDGSGGGGFRIGPSTGEGGYYTDDSASYPTGEASTLEEQAQATVDAAMTPTEPVTEGDAMTVSGDVAAAGSEGFFSKYKWWIAGGVGAAGAYAYLHRTDPGKYPLPDALSKLVRG